MEHDRILGYFLEEAKDHLNTIEQGLRKLPETVRQPAMIRELFRAAHSIKGSAAMLGLLDVQQVGNQFEANFKLLKEQPAIAVDHQLQNLFLESFSFLRAAIDEVRASSDPYRRDPNSPDPVGDPVFEELQAYLQHLLGQIDEPAIPLGEQSFSQDPAVEQVFGDYVTRKLGEITSLCLQVDQPETRTQIQHICQKLGSLGDNFEFLEWTNLFTACRLAIANPQNSLHQLGESISIAVKQAQILILSDRHQAIGITPDLEALIDNAAVPGTNRQDDLVQPEAQLALDSTPPGLSSIYDRVQPLQFDGNDNLADLAAVPEVEADSGSIELDEFMNLLGEDIPADGTWMQDDEFSTSDEFSLEDLADSSDDSLHTARAGHFYEQIFEPSPQSSSASEPSSANEPTIQPMSIVGYDEETFFTPDFDDLDDKDIATFWSDTDLVEGQQPLYQLDDLDLVANAGSSGRFQPEQPLDRDLETPLPDFSLDDRAISDLFPIATATGEWTEAELPPASEADASSAASLSGDFTDYSSDFGEIDLLAEPLQGRIADNDFSVDLQPQQPQSGLDPLGSIGTMDTVEQGLTTHAQDLATHDALSNSETDAADSESGFEMDILASNDASQDFTDLELSDAIELEHLGGTNNQLEDDANEWNDLIREMNIDETDDGGDDLFSTDLAGLEFEMVPASDSVVTTTEVEDRAANLVSDDRAIPDSIDLITESHSSSSLFEDFDNSELPEVSLSGDEVDEFTGWIDSHSDPHRIDDFADLNLDDFNSPEPVADLSVSNDFADLNLDDFNSPEPVTELSVSNDFADLNLDDFNSPEPVADLSVSNDFADLNLDDFNSPEPVADLSVSNDFADLNLDDFNSPDSIVSDDFANLDLNLNQIGSSISTDELADLGNILDTHPESNLGMGDLDALLSGAAAAGAFDDLDVLMGNPAPTGLSAIPTINSPVINPAATTGGKAERRSKQRTFEQTMRVSVRHLDNLNNLVGELVVSRNTLEQDQNRMRQFIEKLLSEVQKLNEVGKRMQDLYERSLMENSLIASRQQVRPQIPQSSASFSEVPDQDGVAEYDPLEMDRFTPIHLLSQKMIELTVRVRESTADIEFVVDGSTEVTRTLRQITGQLQEDLTKSRMIPFAQTADRLQRGVRDNGLKYGKQVELAIEGRDTLIDKVILESLSDPLIHMVNNAIAHGIESPETRQATGKPALGQISVRALHQGNQTIISISDDGAGINTERVKAKAIEKGIITTQQALTMSKTEVYELLFLPSFSTKDQADELAGRGVGMDVVRTSLTEIRGTITTESQLGVGTTFTIRLPLALSIAKALIAVNNKTNIAFPMDGIEDTQDVSPEQIQTNSEGEQCIFWRDNLMPFKPLSDLLGFNRPLPRNNFYGTQEDDNDLVSILILRSDGNLIAVQVDKIIGDQEIAIKPLQGPASKPLGVAGATVLGDGRIIPIADVMELVDLASGKLIRHVSAQWTTQMSAPTTEHRESMVLIVDDSITVRELLSLTFKRAGYRVEQARDGQEAWDKLRAGLPCDIVFCDIEMPRMDGLEFLSRIQKDVALSKVPVAMLTSRGSDRHRQIAAQLGASGYFIKPYLEEALLDAAKRMIKGEVLAIV